MENNQFEDGIKNRMEGAEVSSPSDAVWSSIESKLIVAENAALLRSVVTYRWIATGAAVIALFALTFSIYLLTNEPHVTSIKKTEIAETGRNPKTGPFNKKESVAGKQNLRPQSEIQTVAEGGNEENRSSPDGEINISRNASVAAARYSNSYDVRKSDAADHKVPSETAQTRITATDLKSTAQPDDKISTSVGAREAFLSNADSVSIDSLTTVVKLTADTATDSAMDKFVMPILPERKLSGRFWISAGASKGTVNPGMKKDITGYNAIAGKLPGSVSTSRPKPGVFYSVDLLAGYQILPHWVIQGGVSYLNQTTMFTSDVVNMLPPVSTVGVATSFSIPTALRTYSLNNTVEFVSVPVLLGYKLTGSRASILISAGAAPNVFIRSTQREASGALATVVQNAGTSSSYKDVSWAALFNTEFNYQMGRRIRLAAVPGLRFALNSSMKSDADRPSVLNLGFRVRYTIL